MNLKPNAIREISENFSYGTSMGTSCFGLTSDCASPPPADRRRSFFSQANEILYLYSGKSGSQSGIRRAKADCHLVEPLFAAEECPAECLASYS